MPDTPFPPTQLSAPSVGETAFPMYPYGNPPAFPSWPPPSGGAPFPTAESGPVLNPYPYGSPQPPNISIANPAPPFLAIRYPQLMPVGANGQNQGPGYGLPPTTKSMEAGPALASSSISQIHPAPIMGPGPQGTSPY